MMHCGMAVPWREAALASLARERFDVVVIGGGINGAGIARDAVLRGLRVAVLEQGDFASGTSSRSTKLIHGGLRYLEHGEIRLVLEATRERERLRRLVPHLVRPMRFVMPIYAGARVGRWKLRAGLWAYDLLAGIRNVKRHRMLSAAEVGRMEPALRTDALRGAGEFWDCWTNDARLVVETLVSAVEAGAVALSYAAVVGFEKEDGRIVGVRVHDREADRDVVVRARVVVNASGPWVDEVCSLDAPGSRRLRLTKGAHVIVPRDRVGNDAAWALTSIRDQRVMFVIPWGAHDLVGTTDTDHVGGPSIPPTVDAEDVAYLLETVNHYAPSARLEPRDVVGAYAGLRPLIAPARPDAAPSAISREEEIFESSSGLLSVAGGKLTTYRLIARAVVDRAAARLRGAGRTGIGPCATADAPLAGGIADVAALARRAAERDGHGLELSTLTHLAGRYGERIDGVLAEVGQDASLGCPVMAGFQDRRAEVVAAVDREWARTLEDVLLRRTQLGLLDAATSATVADEVAGLMGERLGWSPDATRAAAEAYVRAVEARRRRWA
jgi:glycerol-3-phosphate dehydrogenase